MWYHSLLGKDRGTDLTLSYEYTPEMGVFKNAKVGDVINFRGNLLRVSNFHKTCAHCFFRNLNCGCIPCTASGDGDTVIYELVKPL